MERNQHSPQEVWRCSECGRVDAVRWTGGRHRHRDVRVFLDPDSIEEPGWCYGEAEGPFVLASPGLEEQYEGVVQGYDSLNEQLIAAQEDHDATMTRLIERRDENKRLLEQLEAARDALGRGRRFERAYQEALGATPTAAQWERLDSLQSAFLDAYLTVLESNPS